MSEAPFSDDAGAVLDPTRLSNGELHEAIRTGRLMSRDVVAAMVEQAMPTRGRSASSRLMS